MVQPPSRLYGVPDIRQIAVPDILFNRCHKGNDVTLLEDRIATLLAVPHAIAVPQARVGIYLLIKRLVAQGQNVVLSPITVFDVVNMVICAGAQPRFADVSSVTGGNLDPSSVRQAIDENTGAVIVTHLNGYVSHVGDIRDICKERNIPLIEDAAQAFGAAFQNMPIGTIGHSGVFSFGKKRM